MAYNYQAPTAGVATKVEDPDRAGGTDGRATATLRSVAPAAWALHAASRYERLGKPFVDRIGAAILLLVLSPVLLVCALAVALTLGVPVLLPQMRVGRHGRPFRIYKFRTMHPDRRSTPGDFVGSERRISHKVPHDPRLTPLGRFLRTWSLDELPQLLNVALGDMSLVGPRPELLQIVDQYDPWQHRRHDVKPGMTGLWQVSARGDAPMHELTEIDLQYLDRVSLWTDLRILALTIPAALGVRQGF